MEEIELLVRKKALKDVELWLYKQYAEIDAKLETVEAERLMEQSFERAEAKRDELREDGIAV